MGSTSDQVVRDLFDYVDTLSASEALGVVHKICKRVTDDRHSDTLMGLGNTLDGARVSVGVLLTLLVLIEQCMAVAERRGAQIDTAEEDAVSALLAKVIGSLGAP